MKNDFESKGTHSLSFSSLYLWAIFIGITSGLGAIFFRYLIYGFTDLFFISKSRWFLIISPTAGGLIVGLLIFYFAREAKGHGVPEVMEALELHGGRIRPRVVIIKALASSVCIGSGGSAGREGPIAQIGSAIGSVIGQKLKLTPYDTKILLSCGAGAGIAATFNTPIGGVLFALELIIREFKTRSFIPIVIATVFATLVSGNILKLLGSATVLMFKMPPYTLKSNWEIIFYFVLGILSGVLGVLFTKSLYATEDLFDKLKIPEYVKPAVGGLVVGLSGLILVTIVGRPLIFGVGYKVIDLMIKGKLLILLIMALVLLKIIATSITIGSGGSGGIFSPSLFIGAMFGAAYGIVLHHFFPVITAGYAGYAIVGMAAVFAGASRAPLTAIVMIFEMTGEYSIILPVMFACVTSDAVSNALMKDTIYTLKLKRRGVTIEHDMGVNLMKTIFVKDIMRYDLETLYVDTTIERLTQEIMIIGHMSYPVLDRNDNLVGIITTAELRRTLKLGRENLTIGDIMQTNLIKVHRNDTLEDVAMRVGAREIGHFPVVDTKDENKLIGFFTIGDMLRAYKQKRIS